MASNIFDGTDVGAVVSVYATVRDNLAGSTASSEAIRLPDQNLATERVRHIYRPTYMRSLRVELVEAVDAHARSLRDGSR